MLASTTTYHASDGTAYERFLGRWTTVLATPLLDFAEFSPVGPLLDVGTGAGSLAVAMTARWPSRRIIGIDVAEPYIRYARSRSTAPFLSFQVGEAGFIQDLVWRIDTGKLAHAAGEEVADDCCDLRATALQREMAGVKHAKAKPKAIHIVLSVLFSI